MFFVANICYVRAAILVSNVPTRLLRGQDGRPQRKALDLDCLTEK